MVSDATTDAKENAAEDVDITLKPCRVTEVELRGLQRTRPDVIDRSLDGVRRAITLHEIYQELQGFIASTNELDVFSGMDISLTETKRGEPGTCRLEIEVIEKTTWMVRAKTFIQDSGAGVEGRLGVRNLRGAGEKLAFHMEYGSHNLRQSAVELYAPRISGYPIQFHAKMFNWMMSRSHFTSCEEAMKGLSLSLASSDRSQSLSYNLGWHQLMDAHLLASTPVQEQLGHQLKSSIKYETLYDNRSAQQLSSGVALRSISQLLGLWPNASVTPFIKQRLDAQLSWKFLPWSSLSIGAATGVLFPLSDDFRQKTSNILDRFHIGGVDSVKGFHHNCIGPTSVCRPGSDTHPNRQRKLDFLGGDVMASAYASLNLFGARKNDDGLGLFGRVFVDVGNVSPLSKFLDGSLRENTKRFAMDYRSSAGFGIVLPIGIGNFEVNYVIPIRYGKHDALRSGLQMSFGTESFTA